MSIYDWVPHGDGRLLDVGINADGSLHNPNGYPPDIVRAEVLAVDAARRERRSTAAKRGAETRRNPHKKQIDRIAEHLAAGRALRGFQQCGICRCDLSADPESLARGIGVCCWQKILAAIEALQAGGSP